MLLWPSRMQICRKVSGIPHAEILQEGPTPQRASAKPPFFPWWKKQQTENKTAQPREASWRCGSRSKPCREGRLREAGGEQGRDPAPLRGHQGALSVWGGRCGAERPELSAALPCRDARRSVPQQQRGALCRANSAERGGGETWDKGRTRHREERMVEVEAARRTLLLCRSGACAWPGRGRRAAAAELRSQPDGGRAL